MSASLAIVIVNWNSGDGLRACLASLAPLVGAAVRQVVVVDNGSSDGSDAGLEGRPGVTVVRAGANLGFGRACNLGARQADGDLLLFLNPDAALEPGTLPATLAFLAEPAQARVGICGVRLRDEAGRVARSCARFPTAGRLVARAVGLDRLFPRLGCAMTEWAHDATRDVDQVIGAFFLVRRELFVALGGFDERFFVYYEEVDFARRARQAGWRSVYFAGAQAFHAGRGTTERIRARRLFYYLRSRLQYAGKHFAWPGVVAVALATLLFEPLLRSLQAAGRGSLAGLGETWSGYAQLWRWLLRGAPGGRES